MTMAETISGISDYIKELEEQNQRLQNMIDTMGEELDKCKHTPAISTEAQEVIDLVGQMARAWEIKFDVLPDGIQELIWAYRRYQERGSSYAE